MKTVVLALLLATALVTGQQDDYVPSDPARIGATGRPQLVEFYHPL